MWGKQNIPHPCTPPPPRLSEEVAQSCCAPDFSDLQGTARSGCLIPLQAKNKIKKKTQNHSTTVVYLSKPINVLQAAKGSSEMRRRNTTEANCRPRGREPRREGSRTRHPRDPRRRGLGSQE